MGMCCTLVHHTTEITILILLILHNHLIRPQILFLDLVGIKNSLFCVDQETMEVLSEHELSPDLFTYDMDLYITLGPGLHFIEFYHVNDSILQDQNWGNDLQPLEYNIDITKVTTEIGEEPWFAPSDELYL